MVSPRRRPRRPRGRSRADSLDGRAFLCAWCVSPSITLPVPAGSRCSQRHTTALDSSDRGCGGDLGIRPPFGTRSPVVMATSSLRAQQTGRGSTRVRGCGGDWGRRRGVATAHELARRGVKVSCSSATKSATVLVRQRRLAHAVAGGPARESEPAAQVLQVDARSREPALHPAAPRPVLPAMARGVPAVGAPRKFERGTAALVELCRVSVDLWESFREAVALAVRLRAARVAGRVREGRVARGAKGQLELVQRAGVRAERWTADEVRDRGAAVVGKQIGASSIRTTRL